MHCDPGHHEPMKNADPFRDTDPNGPAQTFLNSLMIMKSTMRQNATPMKFS